MAQHEITIEEPEGARFAKLLTCTCGWQGRCDTEEEATAMANRHTGVQDAMKKQL
jgi:hypothetical protein